jgi:hypothetical protein
MQTFLYILYGGKLREEMEGGKKEEMFFSAI